MNNLILSFLTLVLFTSCSTTQKTTTNSSLPKDTVRIANEELEYEIIIIDAGFNSYLHSIAKPMNFHSENFLEIKNRFYVTTWNNRAKNPLNYNSSIYENVIDYDYNTHYGLEVNYKLYNYFKFVEHKYGEKF